METSESYNIDTLHTDSQLDSQDYEEFVGSAISNEIDNLPKEDKQELTK